MGSRSVDEKRTIVEQFSIEDHEDFLQCEFLLDAKIRVSKFSKCIVLSLGIFLFYCYFISTKLIYCMLINQIFHVADTGAPKEVSTNVPTSAGHLDSAQSQPISDRVVDNEEVTLSWVAISSNLTRIIFRSLQ